MGTIVGIGKFGIKEHGVIFVIVVRTFSTTAPQQKSDSKELDFVFVSDLAGSNQAAILHTPNESWNWMLLYKISLMIKIAFMRRIAP